MIFKSQKELESFLMKKSRLALLKAQDEVYRIIKNFLYKYYADYEPVRYQRTYQLLSSLVQSRIVSKGKGYEVEVYFDVDGISYDTGEMPSGQQVMEAAAVGMHGASGLYMTHGKSGVNIWEDPIQVLDANAIGILKDMLISEGIPIK